MRYVADTMVIIGHLTQSSKITERVKKILRRVDSGADEIVISAITLMEIMYLAEKGRTNADLAQVVELLSDSDNYLVFPVDVEIILTARMIEDIPELHDRLIAATAKFLDVPIDNRNR
jgi:predicted nucleic acid-binding protein